jgi:hypothetical protein
LVGGLKGWAVYFWNSPSQGIDPGEPFGYNCHNNHYSSQTIDQIKRFLAHYPKGYHQVQSAPPVAHESPDGTGRDNKQSPLQPVQAISRVIRQSLRSPHDWQARGVQRGQVIHSKNDYDFGQYEVQNSKAEG